MNIKSILITLLALCLCFPALAQDKAKPLSEGIDVLKALAKIGDVKAQLKLGKMYSTGSGVNLDKVEAAKWFLKSARQGNEEAQFQSGRAFQFGEGVKKDLGQAVIWYEKAAEQGNADAQHRLGDMYWRGEGKRKDLSRAYSLISQAAESGHKTAAQDKTRFGAILTPEQLNDAENDMIDSYNAIGKALRTMEEDDKAMMFYRRALAVQRRLHGENHPQVAQSHNNLGEVRLNMGDYDNALKHFLDSMAIYSKQPALKEKAGVATSYNNLGSTLFAMYDFKQALEHYQKALDIREKELNPEHVDLAISYHNIGKVYLANGNLNKALELFKNSQKIYTKKLANQGPDEELVSGEADNYYGIGQVHLAKGENQEAIKYIKFALGSRGRIGKIPPHFDASCHKDIAYAQYFLGQQIEALDSAREARAIEDKSLNYILSFASERERLAYQRTLAPFFLMGTLGSAPDLASAILHYKGVVLSSILEDQVIAQASHDPAIRGLVDQFKFASRQLNKLQMEEPQDKNPESRKQHQNKIDAAQAMVERLQQKMAGNNVGGRPGHSRKLLSLGIKDVQSNLPADSLLLEYIGYNHQFGKGLQEVRYGVIIVAKEGEPKWVPLGSAEPINKLLAQYSPMKPAPDEAYEKVLRGLYDKVMAPIVKELPKSTETLILCPDGHLNFLSFATLLTEKDRFLCEDYTIKYVSSGRDLVPGKRINQPRGNLVVFANPTYDVIPLQPASAKGVDATPGSLDRDELRGLKFMALPGTQKEADYLGGKAKDWMLQPKIYTGKTATEAALSQIKSPHILHLATHGFFFMPEEMEKTSRGKRLMLSLGNEQQKYRGPIRNPMHRSGLALAGAQKTLDAWAKGQTPPTENDGILTAAEASVLNLKGTWLVTLSACGTGRGEARSGEGVLGLRRAFIQAGAQNLLMTLWGVSDKYTVKFMQVFYGRVIKSGDAPTTLAEVQKERLLKMRKAVGTKVAVQLFGPFIMSFQRANKKTGR